MVGTIPSTQQALVYEEYNGPLQVKKLPVPEPKEDELLIKIRYSGICHSDLHGWQGDWAEYCTLPTVGGHEGAGEVVKVGRNVTDWKVGDKAGVKIFNNHCFSCEFCKAGHESSCPKQSNHGFKEDGTFQEYLAIRGIDAIRIPEKTDLAAAAPVLCAGVTAYKSLKESGVKAGQIVAITGAGGGLGSFAIQYARVMGIRVLAVDHPSKEQHCKDLGAEWFLDGFNTPELAKTILELTQGGAHGVINLAVNKKAMETSIEYVRTRGTVVFVALPKDATMALNTTLVVFKSITIKGSYLGSRRDVDEALDFVSRGIVKIPYKLVRVDKVADVFQDMVDGKVTSRCVIDFSLQ